MIDDKAELTISRWIEASPARIWQAWSRTEYLAQWWIPAPIECRVIKLDLRPGGGFETRMRQGDEAFQPHVEACFLDVVPESRLVFTTQLAEGWRPIDTWLALTAIITLEDQEGGTRYSARVLHKNAADSRKHDEMGFQEGWGATIDQLAGFVARMD